MVPSGDLGSGIAVLERFFIREPDTGDGSSVDRGWRDGWTPARPDRSTMRCGLLVRDVVHRTFIRPNRRARQRLDHLPRAFWIGDPPLVEVIGTRRDAAVALARADGAGVAA